MSLYVYTYEKQEVGQETSRVWNTVLNIALAGMASLLSLTVYVSSGNLIARSQSPIVMQSVDSNVLGEVSENSISQTPTVTPTVTVTPSPTSAPIASTPTPTTFPQPRNKTYLIAVYGDSMVDTMGERLEYLEHALKRRYPQTDFVLYNFGKGAENVEMGINRFGSELHYQDRNYLSPGKIKPDIFIVGSFAYNPFTPYDRNRHWLGLTKLVEQVKTVSSQVYMLAEIAPLRKDFGKGPNGVNWSEQTNVEHSGRIIEQLENAVGLSKSLGVPLIDVYHRSLASSSDGKREYVNPGDGIHASVAGHEFTAQIIAERIKLE